MICGAYRDALFGGVVVANTLIGIIQELRAKRTLDRLTVVNAPKVMAVRDDSGFVAMLAMKKGDRLLQANGVPLRAPDDVIGAVLRPLASQQPVRVTGTRDGAPREWLLLNAGSCPA